MAFKTMITRLHPLRSLRVETPGEMHLHVDWVLLNPELRCSLCVLIKCNSLETQLNTSILYSIFFLRPEKSCESTSGTWKGVTTQGLVPDDPVH